MTAQRSWTVARRVLACSLVLAACDADRTTTFEPVGPASYDFGVGPSAVSVPGGTLELEEIRTTVDTIQVAGVTSTRIGNLDTVATDSAAIMRIAGLPVPASGLWQVWAMATDGTVAPMVGRVVEHFLFDTGNDDPTGAPILQADSTVLAASASGTYPGSDDTLVTAVAFQVIPGQNTVNPFSQNALFVTMETAAATAPSARQYLWQRHGLRTGNPSGTATVGVPDTVLLSLNTDAGIPDTIEVTIRLRRTLRPTGGTVVSFGAFSGLNTTTMVSTDDYVFRAAANGAGGVRGDEITVDFRELPRPPVGFFYRGWLVDVAGNYILVDTLRSAWDLDPAVSRQNLLDADVNDDLPGIVRTSIRFAQIRNCRSGSGVNNCQNTLDVAGDAPFATISTLRVTFELKDRLVPRGRGQTHVGALPAEVAQ